MLGLPHQHVRFEHFHRLIHLPINALRQLVRLVFDFDVRQDGKPQKITNFSYVNTEAPRQQTKSSENIVPAPPVKTI